MIDVIPWVMSSTAARWFRQGPVFLIGDAAHQLPPTGGFGMNTAVQDAHNLAWKLAFVGRGWANEALLDTYATERRPVAVYNAERSLENTRSVGRIRRIVERRGDPSMTEQQAIDAARRYGNWLGMDLGLSYDDGCLIADGTAAPRVDDPVADYIPTARPGHRAPHVEIGTAGGVGSSLDLYDDQVVVVAGPEAPSLDLPAGDHPELRVVRLGSDIAESADRFAALYGIDGDGAVLVRPDGHVAWRTGADATAGAIEQAIATLLRPPDRAHST